jgi:acetate kinase
MKTGKFTQYAEEAKKRKDFSLNKDNGLSGNGMVPHDLWRRIIPIAREYDKGNVDMVMLYSYLVANVNGQSDNDRYMSAFTSVDRIAADTGIGRNRIAQLSDALESVGLLKTVYDYTSNKREKLYYPQYYSTFTDDELHGRMTEWRRNLDAKKRKSP